MHLLIVNQYGLPAGWSGITRHGDLGAELVRRGHRVTVLASRFNYMTRTADRDRAERESHRGVEFRWLHSAPYANNDGRRTRSMVEFMLRSTMAGMRRQTRPDVVIGSSPHLLAGVSALAIARRHRIPFLFEVRDLWPSALVDLGALEPGGRTHRALSAVERRLYRSATSIITVPPHADRRVAEVGEDASKCVHVPNAIALGKKSDHEPHDVPETLSRVLDGEAGRFITMYTGAHGISNGLDTVLDAVIRLRESDAPTFDRLAIVLLGDGAERTRLQRRAAEARLPHVHFHPPIPKASIPATLARADALLVNFADAPVYEYGLSPNKLFDYMAARRPVLLATRLTDTPIHERGSGMAFEPGNPDSLARALARMVAMSAAEREAMGVRGRQTVAERYTIEKTTDVLEGMLRAVVPSRQRP
ncbi:MAG: glycosyltransferase family 4 protein [Chloroflexi bacterium]|nr:glycosyltransferase family 4 protein [Chloroflexota bacterium]